VLECLNEGVRLAVEEKAGGQRCSVLQAWADGEIRLGEAWPVVRSPLVLGDKDEHLRLARAMVSTI
jgi:hypothetical protein